MTSKPKRELVLAVYSSPYGLGFSVFEGAQTLVDWGSSQIRLNRQAVTLRKLKSLIELYQPAALVLEDPHKKGSLRRHRFCRLTAAVTSAAIDWGVEVRHYSQEQVHEVFRSQNKRQRAQTIMKVLPELGPVPPKRLPWESQHHSMQVFDAVSLALTYFYLET